MIAGEVARRLGVTSAQVSIWASRGFLPAQGPGGTGNWAEYRPLDVERLERALRLRERYGVSMGAAFRLLDALCPKCSGEETS